MTYADDINRENQRVDFYIKFDGIADLIASTGTWPGASGTIRDAMERPPDGSGSRLVRERALVLPGAFSLRVLADDDIHTLFARRGGTTGVLIESLNATATSIKLNRTDMAGTTIYVDRETITVGTHSGSGTYTGCTRGVESSEAKAHSNGAEFSTRPRYWLFRRAQLFAINNDTGSTAASQTVVLRESPRFTDGAYELDFVDITRELRRPIMKGWNATPCTFHSHDPDAATTTFSVGDAREFSTEDDSQVRFDIPGAFFVIRLDKDNVDRVNNRITVRLSAADDIAWSYVDPFRRRDILLGQLAEPEMTARTVMYFSTDLAFAALAVMLSRYGDGGNNASYDILPGVSPALAAGTVDLIEKRVGAALPDGWVDTASFSDLYGLREVQPFYLDEEMELLDWLEKEVAWRLGGYIRITDDGKIGFRRTNPALPDSTLETITQDDYVDGPQTCVDDERPIIAAARVKGNWNPLTRQFEHTIGVTFGPTAAVRGEDAPQVEIESRSLYIQGPSTTPRLSGAQAVRPEQLVTMLDRIYSASRNGVRTVQRWLPWKFHQRFIPGHLFKLTDLDLPDGEGGVGVTARRYEVTEADPQREAGVIRITAEEQPAGYLVGPSAFVASYAAPVITFETAAAHESDLFDSAPAKDFPNGGCNVRIYHAAASFSTSEVVAGERTGDNTFRLSGTPATAPADGDIVELSYGANTGDPADNSDADVQDYLFGADNQAIPELDDGGANERTAQVWS